MFDRNCLWTLDIFVESLDEHIILGLVNIIFAVVTCLGNNLGEILLILLLLLCREFVLELFSVSFVGTISEDVSLLFVNDIDLYEFGFMIDWSLTFSRFILSDWSLVTSNVSLCSV